MVELIWYWTKGESKIYTKDINLAQKAFKDGILVMAKVIMPQAVKC